MARFDVFRNPGNTTRNHYPYLVDIQNSYLDELDTRIVIPLGKAELFKNTVMKGLTPEVDFHDEYLLLLTPQISSISRKQLKDPIGSLAHLCSELTVQKTRSESHGT